MAAQRFDGTEWPHPETSRHILAGGLHWHVQQFGSSTAEPILLLHGTGAATHSWRDVSPLLAHRFNVIAPDLPGHGFTDAPPFEQMSLPSMADLCRKLLASMQVQPTVVAGHSAGAAILVRMALNGYIAPRLIVSINGALLPLQGVPGWLFSPVAKVLARSPFVARMVARRAADPAAIARLVEDTGSKLDARGLALYRRIASRPEHVAAALGMMANWDLRTLEADLPRLAVPLVLLVGARDRTVAPSEAARVKALLPSARLLSLGDLGHLAHEEDPTTAANRILELAGHPPCTP